MGFITNTGITDKTFQLLLCHAHETGSTKVKYVVLQSPQLQARTATGRKYLQCELNAV